MVGTGVKVTISHGETLNLCVANRILRFHFNTIEGDFHFSLSHHNFIMKKAESCKDSAFFATLDLDLEQTPKLEEGSWPILLCQNKIWELWKDNKEDFIFSNPKQRPIRQVHINSSFTHGRILGNFYDQETLKREIIPQSLEIVIYSNWLANFGDLILHACGFVIEGEAFAFLGASGAGKSTLVKSLLDHPDVTILGEDQVVLRYENGAYRIYGTPWHVNEQLCSPIGAPLQGIYFLEREDPFGSQTIAPTKAYERIFQTAFIPYYRDDILDKLMDQILKLIDTIPMRSLSYKLGEDLLKIIHDDFQDSI